MTTLSAARRAAFRAKVNERQGLLVAGAFNAMSA
ncbi:MAG TPA: carboxyvinyl-carboxyphosphonate phosphorylmutase, partial [Cupriavidus sp.]|nr:carboxyvinyl-carboxyphosphonate phosphorylmutase [Cupriavidus sp.]